MEKTQNFSNAIKQLRKSKGITLDQISDSCRIKKNYFEKMEAGNFSFKPNVYVKLFLIEYLKYIDINKVDSIIQEFDNLFNSPSTNVKLTFMPPTTNEDDDDIDLGTINSNNYDPKQIATIILIIIFIIFTYKTISSLLI
tara:strand:+ start:610 stop:1029 length:420 start_codon:yes stop_codon:yes gene_type:complete